MKKALLALFAICAAASSLRAGDMAGLQTMAAGGPVVQSGVFTGDKGRGEPGAVAVLDGKRPAPTYNLAPPKAKPAGVPAPGPDKTGKLNTNEKIFGGVAAFAGTFWLAMGVGTLTAVTVGSVLPIVAGVAAIAFAVGIFTKKIRL